MRDDSKITLTLPRSVLRQLRARTVTEETTIRALMLQALADSGYTIDADEIRDRRSTPGRRQPGESASPATRISHHRVSREKTTGTARHSAAASDRS